MADLPFEIDIQDKQIEIVSECQQVPSDGTPGGIQGGLLCTGFLDVEKVIKKIEPPDVTGAREVRVWFLEKKLPFQLLVLRIPNQVVPPVTTTTTTTTSTSTTSTSTTSTSTTSTSTTSTSTTSTSTTSTSTTSTSTTSTSTTSTSTTSTSTTSTRTTTTRTTTTRTTTSTTTTSTTSTSTTSTTTTNCPFFHPRPQKFFKENFFRMGTLMDTERNCALACVQNRSLLIRNLLTAVLPTVPPTPGCPLLPVDICAPFPPPDANCMTRFVAILTPTDVGAIINAAFPITTRVPTVIRTLTGQFFAVLLNTCLCATGIPKPERCEDGRMGMRRGDIGGVRLDRTVSLNRLPEPTRSNAIAIFGTARPTVQDVINEAERILNVFSTKAAADANATTIADILAAMAQEPPDTIIECSC